MPIASFPLISWERLRKNPNQRGDDGGGESGGGLGDGVGATTASSVSLPYRGTHGLADSLDGSEACGVGWAWFRVSP